MHQDNEPKEIILCYLNREDETMTKAINVVQDKLSQKGDGEWGIYDYDYGFRVHENNIQNSHKLRVIQLKDIPLVFDNHQKYVELEKKYEQLGRTCFEKEKMLEQFKNSAPYQIIQQNASQKQIQEQNIKIQQLENDVSELRRANADLQSKLNQIMDRSEEFRTKLEKQQFDNISLKNEYESFKQNVISQDQLSLKDKQYKIEIQSKQQQLNKQQKEKEKEKIINQKESSGIQSIRSIQTKSLNKSQQSWQQNKKLHSPSMSEKSQVVKSEINKESLYEDHSENNFGYYGQISDKSNQGF